MVLLLIVHVTVCLTLGAAAHPVHVVDTRALMCAAPCNNWKLVRSSSSVHKQLNSYRKPVSYKTLNYVSGSYVAM